MTAERRLVYYSGRVQGVGFRYTTRRIAAGFDVAGYVRNLPDGRVELVAEGNTDQLDRFLGKVRARFDGYIRDEAASTMASNGQFRSFEIRH